MKGNILTSGDKCPYCKKGRILLADTFTSSHFEVDPEPYTAEKKESPGGDEIMMEDGLHIQILGCDNCGKIVEAEIDGIFHNDNVQELGGEDE